MQMHIMLESARPHGFAPIGGLGELNTMICMEALLLHCPQREAMHIIITGCRFIAKARSGPTWTGGLGGLGRETLHSAPKFPPGSRLYRLCRVETLVGDLIDGSGLDTPRRLPAHSFTLTRSTCLKSGRYLLTIVVSCTSTGVT